MAITSKIRLPSPPAKLNLSSRSTSAPPPSLPPSGSGTAQTAAPVCCPISTSSSPTSRASPSPRPPSPSVAPRATSASNSRELRSSNSPKSKFLARSSPTSPYSLSWNIVPPGSYSLTARAMDAAGLFTNSTPANIIINPAPPADAAPSVSLAAPVNGATFPSPASVSFSVIASDPDGNLARVELYNGATKLTESSTVPFSFSAENLAPGAYVFTARAIDSAGLLANANLTIRVLSRQLQSLKSAPARHQGASNSPLLPCRSESVVRGSSIASPSQSRPPLRTSSRIAPPPSPSARPTSGIPSCPATTPSLAPPAISTPARTPGSKTKATPEPSALAPLPDV